MEWNELDPQIQNTPSLNIFREDFLKLIRPTANNILQGYDFGLVTFNKF